MAELVFLYYASASSMPSSNKRFSRSFVTSVSRSSQECHCWLAPSARHSSTIRIITHLYSRANGNLLPKGPTTDHERPQTGKQRDDLFKSGVCQQSFTKSVEDRFNYLIYTCRPHNQKDSSHSIRTFTRLPHTHQTILFSMIYSCGDVVMEKTI